MVAQQKDDVKTIEINKFNGRITRFRDGDMNSGMCVQSSFGIAWGYDTQQQSGNLIFTQSPYSIAGSIITDLVVAGRVRVENGISYLYAVGHTGRVYKIQINDTVTKNPDFDTPVLLTTLTLSQTFQIGSSIQFFTISGTEYIWIGHDNGVTRLNFDGTGEVAVGDTAPGHWVSAVPRQVEIFIGSLFYTNGSNIAQIDSTGSVTNYQKLSPGFPSNMTARDLHSTIDGIYLVTVVTRAVPGNQVSVVVDTNITTATNSLLAYWNGSDLAATSSSGYPDFPVTAYYTFGGNEYLFGEQIGGAMLATPANVINVLEFETSPVPNAVASSGDYLGWYSTRFVNGVSCGVSTIYGTIDNETPVGFYKQLLIRSSLTNGDIVRIPFGTPVSSWQPSGATSGYTNQPFQLFGTGKSYFSTLEYDGVTTKYGFYAYKNVVDFLSAAGGGNYQTQNQIFSKKVKATEVRIYVEPLNALASFQIDLIGINGLVMEGTTQIFPSSPQYPSITGLDRVKYNPSMLPTSAIGVRITNIGPVTPVIHKIEVDYSSEGN